VKGHAGQACGAVWSAPLHSVERRPARQVDAVSACHSATLAAPQAAAALGALRAYHERFRGRLAPGAAATPRSWLQV